ncbi:MAG: UbiA-like protein EboC [Armatimonadetes bacterium]|nr:UbiA-like protein EboC [Armatimonadota bacterium]
MAVGNRALAGLRRSSIWPYLQLLRPPNLLTAAADILAGYAAAGLPDIRALPWLLLATIGLYGGGVALNDVCDAKVDARERPERPIPSGRVGRRGAALLGMALLAAGIGAAGQARPVSGALALGIAAAAVLYNAWGKRHPILGPLNMGACRGLNLLLGVSAAPALLRERYYLALIPVLYIAAITAVGAGEVHGGKRGTGGVALGLLGVVGIGLLALTWRSGWEWLARLPFLALFVWRVVPPFWRAYREPQPGPIRGAVQAGVLSLIVLDAAIAAGYAGPLYGLIVLALLIPAAPLARWFAVT